jgi:DNA-binding NtrC family response regulator
MGGSRILVIDDERVICNGCRLALEEEGHSVDLRMTGKTGLEAVLGEPYEVVLLDLKLPDKDGMDILKTVRKKRPDIDIIIMTGHSTVQNAVEAMKLGAFDYLSKPFSDDEVTLAVERAVQKRQLVKENLSLRKQLIDRFGFSNIVGRNPKILRIFEQIERVASTDTTVLLNGESGTGKELFARAIHAHSQNSSGQFVALDCSTLSPNLLESELFGHVKGAFTGAVQDRAGVFEAAHGGTLFLDEIANLSMEIQGKLLRVLEVQEYKPVGTSLIKKANVRVIAATNRDLKTMLEEGSFREDLFYRLNVFPIFLPALRERRDDIAQLAYHFLRLFCRKTGKKIEGFSDEALEMLINYEWPGNVRQLKNVIERLAIMADQGTLDLLNLLDHMQITRSWKENSIPETLQELKAMKKRLLDEGFSQIEKAFLINALKDCNGNITHAADKVGMQRANFSALMKKHHVSPKGNIAQN